MGYQCNETNTVITAGFLGHNEENLILFLEGGLTHNPKAGFICKISNKLYFSILILMY